MEQTKEKKYIVGSILIAVLTALGLASATFSLFQNFLGSTFDVVTLTDIIVLLLIIFYTVVGYKKPHGNLLKTLMLIDAISTMPRIINDASSGWIFLSIINLFTIICIAYVAGRLDRIDQNKFLMLFILILSITSRIVVAFCFKSSFDLIICIGRSANIIIWLDICAAYFLRYKQHREAGLEDASKK